MTEIASFRELVAWQRAMDLAERVYEMTEHFPPRERFGLAQQARKSAVSIPSNVAEGSRLGTTAYAHHVLIALGSHAELDTQCELASRLRLISLVDYEGLSIAVAEVGRILHGLHRSLPKD